MLLIIHNLPSNTRYADVKELIKDKCGLTEMIVDNLVAEGKHKKVTVGLADEGDAAILVRKINGLYVCNQQLYVEDVRQKKTGEQPYCPNSMSKPFNQEQFNQCPPPFNQFFGQQDEMQYQQPLLTMEGQLTAGPSAPNFGVPFYMTTQNQNVGNNPQFMVQYPKLQGPGGNDSYEGQDTGFGQQYGGRKRDQSMSPDHGPCRERSPKRSSRWSEPDSNRSDRRSRDRPSQRDNKPYKDKFQRDSYQSRSNQDYGSNKQHNSDRFQKPFNRPEPNWERPDRSTYDEKSEPQRFRDNRNFNAQDYREREPQRFREGNSSQARGSDYESRPREFKKRPYESPDKNKFGPPNKKFGGNQQRNVNHQGASGSSFSKNYQNKKNSYSTKLPARAPVQQNRPFAQPKGQQKAKGQFKQNYQNQKPTEEMLARYEAWRVQATSLIATQILNNVGKKRNRQDPIFQTLKSCVRARIDVILGDDMSFTLRDILSMYREKFEDDEAFFNTVREKAAKGELDDIGTRKDSEAKSEIRPKVQFIGKPPAIAPTPSNTDRLPKYPDGNKKVLNQLKLAQKEEMLNDSLYNLDEEHDKALNEEFDKLDELIKTQYENPEGETEKSIAKFMDDIFVPDLRRILTLHVKKRILDVRTNLSVRVISQYKPPKRDVMDAFLKDYGVVSLKVSDKNKNIMIAICDSYENFDALCKLESTLFGDLKVSFKPLHLTGPPLKGKFKKQAENLAKLKNKGKDNISATTENKGENDSEQINNKNEATKSEENEDQTKIEVKENQGNEDNECEIIPSNNTAVIVIDEQDNKSTAYDVATIVDEASKTDANVKETCDNEESTIETESAPDDSEKATVTDDNQITAEEIPGLIDNDNIAEDDLEDF